MMSSSKGMSENASTKRAAFVNTRRRGALTPHQNAYTLHLILAKWAKMSFRAESAIERSRNR